MPEVAHPPKTPGLAPAFPTPGPECQAREVLRLWHSCCGCLRLLVRPHHLVKEGPRLQTQSEDRDPQHPIAGENDVVLPQCVVDWV